jgi:hypothetical protein
MTVHYALLGHMECKDLDESNARRGHCHQIVADGQLVGIDYPFLP